MTKFCLLIVNRWRTGSYGKALKRQSIFEVCPRLFPSVLSRPFIATYNFSLHGRRESSRRHERSFLINYITLGDHGDEMTNVMTTVATSRM